MTRSSSPAFTPLRSCLAAAVLALFCAASSRATVLYSTDFGDPPYSTKTWKWSGVEGWLATDPASGTAAVTSDGGAVYLGTVAPKSFPAGVYRHLDFDPVAAGLPIVKIRTSIALKDSMNGRYDTFALAVYNRGGDPLCALLIDNEHQSFAFDNGAGVRTPGANFTGGAYFPVVLTLDFTTQVASAEVEFADGSSYPLFADQPFNAAARPLDLGSLSFLWMSGGDPGDNALIVDSLSVEALPASLLGISNGPVQHARGPSFMLQGSQSVGDAARIEWRAADRKAWTGISGVAPHWAVRLEGIQPGRSVINVRVKDGAGNVVDSEKVTILRKP